MPVSTVYARSAQQKPISPPPSIDKFPYGWRLKTKTLPSGDKIDYEVPLTIDDLLEPQLGDCMIQRDRHLRSNTNLFTVFDNRYANDPSVGVFSDLKMVWGIPGLKEPAPDVAVVPNLQNQDEEADRPTFKVLQEGTRPGLVIEVMSPGYPGDDTEKVDIYEQAGVQEYFIINPHSEKVIPYYEIRGYQLVGGKYKLITPDKQGRLLSQTTGVWFGVYQKGRRLKLRDAHTGKWLLNARETEAALLTETKARQKAEERALAEAAARIAEAAARIAEAAARLEAEKRAQAEAKARLEAEERAQAEAKARLEAEERAQAEAEARLEAEKRAQAEAAARLETEAQIQALKKRLEEQENQSNPEEMLMRS